ncbi:MAG: DUF5686 family protein [Chitinophagaceae bacterium]
MFAQIEFKDSINNISADSISQENQTANTFIPTNKPCTIQLNIRDFTTDEGLSFATVSFLNTGIGKRADIDGQVIFENIIVPYDTILISAIGYAKKKIYINPNDSYQSYKIEMPRTAVQIKDMVIKVSRNPALKLVKQVIANKPHNNYDKANNYSYEVYNKIEVDINKIPKTAFKKSPILKKFDFVEQYIDSTSEDKPFLPLFLTETISDYYYQQKPKLSKEYIKGSRVSGYKNASMSKMLGSMYQNINVYENKILVFDINFISPIANDAPSFYTYHLVDTQEIKGKLCYQVMFVPKRQAEHTFYGDMWIHDTDFAIQKVSMIISKDQQVNWVNKIDLLQEFSCFEDTLWFLTKDKFYVDFLPPHGNKVAGFLGRKTTTYKNIQVNQESIANLLNQKKKKGDSDLDPLALERNEDYWNSVRHDSLSKNEKAIYHLIDTIQNLPVYKKYYNAAYFIGTGIKELGPLEIGSLYNLYSKNVIEGSRIRFNMGTTPKLFKNIYLRSYIAYGFQDERFKYMGSMLWLLKRHPRQYIYAEYKHDLDNNLNQYDNSASVDNIFSTIGRKKSIPWKLSFLDRIRIEYYNSYFNGFSYQVFAEKRTYTPYTPLPYEHIFLNDLGATTSVLKNNEFGVNFRFAYKEQFVEGNYYRTSLGTSKPILNLTLSAGFKNVLEGQHDFQKIRFSVTDRLKSRYLGSIFYTIFAGKIWGELPYPLLEIHPGNEYYYYNTRAFNLMQRYEYLSDQYVGVMMEHSTGPLFFRYIPLIKKMKLRTFWNFKSVYGSLSQQNKNLNLNKGYPFQSLSNVPYAELGAGVENIFKVLRVDFVWRAIPITNSSSNATPLGIFGSLKFNF